MNFREFLFAALLKRVTPRAAPAWNSHFREFLFAALLKPSRRQFRPHEWSEHFREFLFAALLKLCSRDEVFTFSDLFPRISIRGFIEA